MKISKLLKSMWKKNIGGRNCISFNGKGQSLAICNHGILFTKESISQSELLSEPSVSKDLQEIAIEHLSGHNKFMPVSATKLKEALDALAANDKEKSIYISAHSNSVCLVSTKGEAVFILAGLNLTEYKDAIMFKQEYETF